MPLPVSMPDRFNAPRNSPLNRCCRTAVRRIGVRVRALLLAGLGTLLTHPTATADELRITVAGGAVRGADSVIGEALGAMVRREHPQAAYTYEPGNVAGNLVRLAAGTHSFATTGPVELAAARKGAAPFPRPVDTGGFRAIARVAEGVLMYFVAREEFLAHYDIRTLADLNREQVEVRMSIGRIGTPSVREQALSHLAAVGLTPEIITARGGITYDYAMPEAMDLLRNGRLDVAFTGGHFPEARILELARATPIRFIPLGEAETIQRVARQTGAEIGIIPAGTYPFLDQDYPTTALSLYLIAGPAAQGQVIEKIARALHRQFAYLERVHPMYGHAGPGMLTRTGAMPLHPAAAAYYRQAGLLGE